jgi:hypothetical protein
METMAAWAYARSPPRAVWAGHLPEAGSACPHPSPEVDGSHLRRQRPGLGSPVPVRLRTHPPGLCAGSTATGARRHSVQSRDHIRRSPHCLCLPTPGSAGCRADRRASAGLRLSGQGRGYRDRRDRRCRGRTRRLDQYPFLTAPATFSTRARVLHRPLPTDENRRLVVVGFGGSRPSVE